MEATYLFYLPIMVGLYMVTLHILRKLQKRPPRPFFCFPLFGHFLMLEFPLAECLAKLAQRYGPVVFLEFGWMTSLSVCSPSAAEECLSKNDAAFCNRPHNILIGKYAGNNFTSINFSPYGPHWRNLRRIVAVELLSTKRLQSSSAIHIRAEEVTLMIQHLLTATLSTGGGSSSSSEKIVEVRYSLFNLAMSVMTRLIFDRRYQGLQGKKLANMVDTFFGFANVVHIGDFVPYLRWLDWSKEKRLKKFKQDRDGLMRELVEEYIHDYKRNDDESIEVKPVLQVLLDLQQSEPEYYRDDIIYSILLDLLVGGSDSSATTLEWALSLLLNNPEVLEKARIEIDNHVGHEQRFLEESDLKHLPYIGCIIKETLRMYPPNPTLFPHESSKECVLEGYRIAPHTALDVNIWAIQNDPKIWGDPECFRPERFEGVEGYRIGFKMLPFGAGRRICPGEGLAVRVVGLALASLIHCFEWERVDEKLVDMNKVPDLFMHKIVPLQAKVQPRQAMMKLLTNM